MQDPQVLTDDKELHRKSESYLPIRLRKGATGSKPIGGNTDRGGSAEDIASTLFNSTTPLGCRLGIGKAGIL